MTRLFTSTVAALLCLGVADTCAAQTSPWTVDYAGERADVSNGGADSWWNSDRVQGMWARPDIGGWLVAVERDTRGALSDIAISGFEFLTSLVR